MHSYLPAIGFDCLRSRDELDAILTSIRKDSKNIREYQKEDGVSFVEIDREFALGLGIRLVGEVDKSGFRLLYYFPYLNSSLLSCTQNVFVNRRVDIEAYTGMSEDIRMGVSLIYYIQNAVDYLEAGEDFFSSKREIILTALANDGKIILPIEASCQAVAKEENLKKREALVNEAKKGNQTAIETLTLEEIDKYSSVMKRLKTEDLFSIVETTFMPCGSESDIYNIIGIIRNKKLVKNRLSGETIYIMELDCNGMPITLAVNKNKLVGEPEEGRRFKGSVWLQGIVK